MQINYITWKNDHPQPMKKRTKFQDYLGEHYSNRKKRLYYTPKLTNPLGKFAIDMFTLLEKNDIVKIQEKGRELQEWKGKNNLIE